LPATGHHAIVAAALISISINPFLFRKSLELEVWLKRFPRAHAWLAGRDAKKGEAFNRAHPLSDDSPPRAIIVGYGPVGRTVTRRVKELRLEPLVIDMNIDTVLGLQAEGERALYGDATKADILRQAGASKAAYLIVTIPDTAVGVAVALAARELSRGLKIYARARHSGNAEMFERAGVVSVCYDEAEVATALTVVLQADIKAADLDQK
jgi:CPA2 family monovalent cation:H+ antiporter-2